MHNKHDHAIVTEEELAEAAVAERVTPQDLLDNVKHVAYFSAYQGAVKAAYADAEAEGTRHGEAVEEVPESLKLLTICVITLQNGFTVMGQSACAHPENFNADFGKRLAYTDAEAKMWPLMGYHLKQKLFEKGIG
jgi:hypothetical protein